MKGESNDKLFCWEQVLRTNRPFRTTHLFAGKSVQERLLALYALFSVFEQAVTSVSDEAVAARKLSWWHDEMKGGVDSSSSHPVIAELCRSGASTSLLPGQVQNLIDATAHRIDASAPAGEGALEELCLQTGLPLVELELAVCDAGSCHSAPLKALVVRRGLMQLIRESLAREDGRGFWWVPLELLARHDLARADLLSTGSAETAPALMSDILTMKSLNKTPLSVVLRDISEEKQEITHLFVYDVLNERKLNSTKFGSCVIQSEELDKLRIGDLFSCWKTARRINLWK